LITLDQVSKSYDSGKTFAVCELSLEVAEGETLALLGSSGCGKTTTLKMINRLIEPSGGRIEIDGRDVMKQDPIALRRRIGFAIQHIGLFPHMTVGRNVAVVPRLLGWGEQRIADRVDELLTMVGLEPGEFRGRFPSQLSGGQCQRVGVARALASDPPIVLMDEPFGALDPITREQLQNEFLELESEIRKTVLFVTHDVFEAVKVGDRVAILNEGRLQQLASPRELVESPANEFVDQFLGRHRFQLSLLTRTVGSVLGEMEIDMARPPAERPGDFLSVRSSLIEALDLFKRSGAKAAHAYDRQRFVGHLAKRQLLAAISQVLGEA